MTHQPSFLLIQRCHGSQVIPNKRMQMMAVDHPNRLYPPPKNPNTKMRSTRIKIVSKMRLIVVTFMRYLLTLVTDDLIDKLGELLLPYSRTLKTVSTKPAS